MKNNNFKKNFIWNIIGTTINAFNSLFFMIIVTRINGVDYAGIFTFAFSTALLFNVIGMYSGRVYQVTDQSGASDTDFIMSKVITCSLMLIVSVIFIAINKYNAYKIAVILLLCFLKCLEAFAESIYAIFQKNEDLYKVGISLTLKSLIGLLIFIIVDLVMKDIIYSVIGLIICNIIVLIGYDFYNLRKCYYEKKSINFKNVSKILLVGVFPFIVTFLSQYLINASKYAIDALLPNSDQTIYGILIMPATVILLFGQFIIHPYITKISKLYNEGKAHQLFKMIISFIGVIIGFGCCAVLAAYLLGIPVLQIIYGLELGKYRLYLVMIMVGGSVFGIVSILSNMLIAMHKNVAQAGLLAVLSALAYYLSYHLTASYKLIGATLSYTVVMCVAGIAFICMILFFVMKMKKSEREEY